MKVIIKRLFNQNSQETGSVLTALSPVKINLAGKKNYEFSLEDYAHTKLYPGEGLNIYSEKHVDIASIVVLKNIDSLPFYDIDLPLNDIIMS